MLEPQLQGLVSPWGASGCPQAVQIHADSLGCPGSGPGPGQAGVRGDGDEEESGEEPLDSVVRGRVPWAGVSRCSAFITNSRHLCGQRPALVGPPVINQVRGVLGDTRALGRTHGMRSDRRAGDARVPGVTLSQLGTSATFYFYGRTGA